MTGRQVTVDQALAAAQAHGLARHEAPPLLAGLLQRPRTWLLTHGDSLLSTTEAEVWQQWLQRAEDGEPLAYLRGQQAFSGLDLQVGPGVLVPRPDTETLVDWALALLKGEEKGDGKDEGTGLASLPEPRVIDLGTGSGAIALAVKHHHPSARVSAVERSGPALEQARRNALRLRLDLDFHQGDWWTPVAGQAWHLALSNPPYIADTDPHLPALHHEPRAALVSGADGLADLQQIIAGAPDRLLPGGWLLLEHGFAQAEQVQSLLRQQGFEQVQSRADLAGHLRCSGGRWPGRQLSPPA